MCLGGKINIYTGFSCHKDFIMCFNLSFCLVWRLCILYNIKNKRGFS